MTTTDGHVYAKRARMHAYIKRNKCRKMLSLTQYYSFILLLQKRSVMLCICRKVVSVPVQALISKIGSNFLATEKKTQKKNKHKHTATIGTKEFRRGQEKEMRAEAE